MKYKIFILIMVTSLFANWSVSDSNGNNKLTLEPNGDFNISTGNFHVQEGNMSVKGDGNISGNLAIGGDLTIGGSFIVSNPLPHLDINYSTVTEGDEADLKVTLLDKNHNVVTANNDIVINFKTMNGSAVDTQDYDKNNSTVTLKAGDSSVTIPVYTIDDSANEYNRTETMFVKIWLEGDNRKYATACSTHTGIVGITDNDDNGNSDSGSSDDSGGGGGLFF